MGTQIVKEKGTDYREREIEDWTCSIFPQVGKEIGPRNHF